MDMLRKGYIYLLAIFLPLIASLSCTNEEGLPQEDLIQLRTPFGEWVLEGFATTNQTYGKGGYLASKQQYSLERVKSKMPLKLTLTKEGTFTASTPSNKISGEFTFVRSRGIFSFDSFNPDKNNIEQDEGAQYLSCLKLVCSYAVFDQKLYLYYTKDESKFLLFNAAD